MNFLRSCGFQITSGENRVDCVSGLFDRYITDTVWKKLAQIEA